MRNNLFIVLEGPDASGKTSIAIELAKKIGAKYFERTPDLKPDTSKIHKIEYYEDIGRKLSLRIKKELERSSIVIARYVYSISAIFYANTSKIRPIIGGVIKPDHIIYCYANSKILKSRIKKRLDDGKNVTDIERNLRKFKRLCKRYDDLFNNRHKIIRVDTSIKNVDQSVNKILKLLDFNKQRF